MQHSSHWDEVHLTSSYPSTSGDCAGHFIKTEALAAANNGKRVLVLAPIKTPTRQKLFVSEECPRLFIYNFSKSQIFGSPGLLSNLRVKPWLIFSLINCIFSLFWSPIGFLKKVRIGQLYCHWLVPGGFPFIFALHKASTTTIVCHGSDIELLNRRASVARWALLFLIGRKVNAFRFVSKELQQKALRWMTPANIRSQFAQATIKPSPLSIPINSSFNSRRLQQESSYRYLLAEISRQGSIGPQVNHYDSSVVEGILKGQLNDKRDSFMIVVIGRLIYGKRIMTALNAAALVPKATTIVIGEGPLLFELMERFPSTLFLGQLKRKETLHWLSAADVLVSASRKEGAPTVVREALQLNVPVVATQAGDLRAWSTEQLLLHIVE